MAAVFENGLTNVYIAKFLTAHSKNFRGVFSANNINNRLLTARTFSIVCNLSRHDESGSHFITILAYPKYILYIDSFGLQCFNSDIKKFMKRLDKPIFHSTSQVQALSSNFCGFFCILQVLARESKIKVKFSKNPKNNDATCIKHIKRMIQK
jgi:hypothetical protein